MEKLIQECYNNPNKKFCFYTGGANKEVAKLLGNKK